MVKLTDEQLEAIAEKVARRIAAQPPVYIPVPYQTPYQYGHGYAPSAPWPYQTWCTTGNQQ